MTDCMDAWQLTLAVNVTTLVLGAVKTVHLAIGSAVRATIHVEAILGTVMVVQGGRARRTNAGAASRRFEAIRVERAVLDAAAQVVHVLSVVLL